MADAHPQREEYTVGWICAFSYELEACRLMFDETFGETEVANPADRNTYSFGRIAQHKIVAACLPEGSRGTSAAATVAGNLLASFPSVRFGISVGVGGGCPSEEHDIRLGDVVVSIPHGTFGGVIQHDLGKYMPRGFQRVGSLNRPPEELLTAVAKLRSSYQMGLSKMPLYLSRLPQRFQRPKASDRLFQPQYEHRHGGTCEDCDPTKTVLREERDNNEPDIHYGLIASGNGVIEDAVRRDELQQKYDVLCAETVAAGLMNIFPCIVARGICDYNDSHKSKKWQNYAAATSAAWAKELLYTVKPFTVKSMPAAFKQDLQDVEYQLVTMIKDTKQKAIDKSPTTLDSSDNYMAARETWQPNSTCRFSHTPESEG